MKKISFCVLLSLMMFSLPAFSGQWSIASKVRMTYLHNHHGGYGVFQLENMSANPDKCTSPAYYVVSKVNNPVFEIKRDTPKLVL